MKIKFKEERFSDAALAMIAAANQIIGRYSTRLTSRQIYYQFVSHVPGFSNDVDNYKRVTDVLSRGRMAGLIDWDRIEDRGRVVAMPGVLGDFNTPDQAVRLLSEIYRVKRWQDQPVYAELWAEKQALGGMLQPIADKVHVPFMMNKGYSSSSAMFDASLRFRHYGRDKDKVIFYLGDFDPSGEDMVRDIRDRMELFRVPDLRVEKLALTWAQIELYNPPPNPAKVTDPRAKKYIEEHGDESWEVDALEPDAIEQIIMDAFKEVVDVKLMKAAKKREKAEAKYILDLVPPAEETT